jgi:hypothetical protein
VIAQASAEWRGGTAALVKTGLGRRFVETPYPLPERGLLLTHNRALLLTSATQCGRKPYVRKVCQQRTSRALFYNVPFGAHGGHIAGFANPGSGP